MCGDVGYFNICWLHCASYLARHEMVDCLSSLACAHRNWLPIERRHRKEFHGSFGPDYWPFSVLPTGDYRQTSVCCDLRDRFSDCVQQGTSRAPRSHEQDRSFACWRHSTNSDSNSKRSRDFWTQQSCILVFAHE